MRDFSRLTRAIQKMPACVRQALTKAGLTAAYRARPAYQQNDYLSWINRAKRPETKQNRLAVMLEDLRRGDRYMGMPYGAGKKRKTG
ncbi:MAG: YdeI/OmpD-associated family protein [Anaerolineales bacterium]